jgi:hypothetical protein
MLYEMVLKDKLPMLLQSLAVAVVIFLVREEGRGVNNIFALTMTIFGSAWLLQTYAPKIQPSRGMGFGIGLRMLGGDGQEDTCLCQNRYALKEEKHEPKDSAKTEHVASCKDIFSAGFNMNWTSHVVDKMLKTPEGRKKLYDIDEKMRKSVGRQVRKSDILKCVPGYIDEYICRKSR